MAGSGNQQNYSVYGHQVSVGLSAIARFSLQPGQQGLALQVLSGGSCFFGGASLGLGGSFGMLAPTTIYNIDNYRGDLYFASVGATSVVRILAFYSAGF